MPPRRAAAGCDGMAEGASNIKSLRAWFRVWGLGFGVWGFVCVCARARVRECVFARALTGQGGAKVNLARQVLAGGDDFLQCQPLRLATQYFHLLACVCKCLCARVMPSHVRMRTTHSHVLPSLAACLQTRTLIPYTHSPYTHIPYTHTHIHTHTK